MATNSTPGSATRQQPSLGETFGAVELGALVSTLLYGTAVVQTYIYASTYGKDRRWYKVVVGTVMSLETIHTVCTWMWLYFLTVTNFGNPAALNQLPMVFNLTMPLQTLASSVVQAFFSHRVHILSGHWWTAAPAYAAQALRVSIGIAVAVLCTQSRELSIFHARYGYVVNISLTLSVVSDLWNTVLLCIYLRGRKSSYASTQNAVHRIVLWSIETGIITTLIAVLILAFFTSTPGNGIWVCFYLIYPKMYPNSLLVSLNSRAPAQDSGSTRTPTYDISVQHVQSVSARTGAMPDSERGQAVQLNVMHAVPKAGYAFEDYK